MTSWFYSGAKHIEEWLDRPRVGRFMDAASMWYMVVAAVFVVTCVVILVVALAEHL